MGFQLRKECALVLVLVATLADPCFTGVDPVYLTFIEVHYTRRGIFE